MRRQPTRSTRTDPLFPYTTLCRSREPSGPVGRVSETGSNAARVMLLTHVDSRVQVAMVRDGTPALVFGRNDALLEVKTVITDRNPFRPGDLLITSGAGGIYPPDVAVAVVVKPTAEEIGRA